MIIKRDDKAYAALLTGHIDGWEYTEYVMYKIALAKIAFVRQNR